MHSSMYCFTEVPIWKIFNVSFVINRSGPSIFPEIETFMLSLITKLFYKMVVHCVIYVYNINILDIPEDVHFING